MAEISVIVPVYRAEQYLEQCVESILAQTFTDLEVILVDDGSPDNSGAMCDEFARKDSRVRVIHRKNGGASAAKNSGLEIATGRYIGFVDSDDRIHPQMYELLHYYAVTDGSDIVSTERAPSMRKEHFDPVADGESREVVTADKVLAQFYQTYYGKLWMSYQIKLFHRDIFKTQRFREGIMYEDTDLFPFTVRLAHKITIVPFELYSYTLSQDSVMRAQFSAKRLVSIDVWKRYTLFFDEQGLFEQRDYYAVQYLYDLVSLYERVKTQNSECKNAFKKYIKEYRAFRPWLRKKCKFAKLQRVLLMVFPAMPTLATKIYNILSR